MDKSAAISGSGIPTIVPPAELSYYKDMIYWNAFAQVKHHLNSIITANGGEHWSKYLARTRGGQGTAYSLNCGNGRIERLCFAAGLISQAIGSDVDRQSLATAEIEAAKIGFPARYLAMDANTADLSGLHFSCAINNAGLHHVACIDHIVREICRALPDRGLFINYDYVGPHRNQYPWDMWSKVVELRDRMPAEFRNDLHYPHMTSMLAMDPTEAIHSELIVETIERYFQVIECKPLGGALAYSLLYENRGLFAAAARGEDDGWVARIIEADVAFTDGRLDRSLFAFIIGVPNKPVLDAADRLERWTRDEQAREARARGDAGRYVPRSALEIIYDEMGDLKLGLRAARDGNRLA